MAFLTSPKGLLFKAYWFIRNDQKLAKLVGILLVKIKYGEIHEAVFISVARQRFSFVSEPFIGHATDDDQSPCTTINIIYFERA